MSHDADPADPLRTEPAAASLGTLRSFERHLRARNLSARTIEGCLDGLGQAERFLAGRGLTFETAGRGDLEAFLVDILTVTGRRRPPPGTSTWAGSTSGSRKRTSSTPTRWRGSGHR
jgi:hypothetical protein